MKFQQNLFASVLALTVFRLHAQELVVIECATEAGKWSGTAEIDLKNKRIKYDNAISRFASNQWNEFNREYAINKNIDYEPKKYEPSEYEITNVTKSEIQARDIDWKSKSNVTINRYTLMLKDEYGEYKCQKKLKEF